MYEVPARRREVDPNNIICFLRIKWSIGKIGLSFRHGEYRIGGEVSVGAQGGNVDRAAALMAIFRAPDGTEFSDRAKYRNYVFLTQYTFKDR